MTKEMIGEIRILRKSIFNPDIKFKIKIKLAIFNL